MWGNNEKDQKVLIAVSLRAKENMVDVFTFPFESTTEEFYNLMLNEWRESHEVPFPEGYTHIERPLTAADSILPDNLKVDRSDIIQRAQTEWHFLVLSNKLYQSFLNDLEEIKEKIKGADSYKNHLWEEMKEAWEKIQKNIFDKTLLREHGQQLRELTNDIFTQLKNMRRDMDSEIDRVSHGFVEKFNASLDEVEQKIKSGLGLQPLFNDLKRLQQEFKDASLSKNDRAKIWKRIDAAFKQVKEKKFGEKSSKVTSALDRLNRRYEGLMSAIDKMSKSIRRDDKDKHFQDDRIANTEGQLEAQIRMAKLKMIDERINSKNEKLNEMLKTKAELEERIAREKKFLEEQKKHQSLKEELHEAKETVKQKIAENIHAQADNVDTEAMEKAAEAFAKEKAEKNKSRKKETFLGAVGETLGESLQGVEDNLGAIASVVGDKIEEAMKDLNAKTKEKIEVVKDKFQDMETSKKEDWEKDNPAENKTEGSDAEKHGNVLNAIGETLKDIGEDLGTLASGLIEKVEEGVKEMHLKEKASDAKETLTAKASDLIEKIEEGIKEMHVKEKVKDMTENLGETIAHVKEEIKEKVEDVKEKMKSSKSKTDEDDNKTETV
jgi:hypothetical protein